MMDKNDFQNGPDGMCHQSFTRGPSWDPYGTNCELEAGHKGPHRGHDPFGVDAMIEWEGGGYCAGDPLPVRNVRTITHEDLEAETYIEAYTAAHSTVIKVKHLGSMFDLIGTIVSGIRIRMADDGLMAYDSTDPLYRQANQIDHEVRKLTEMLLDKGIQLTYWGS